MFVLSRRDVVGGEEELGGLPTVWLQNIRQIEVFLSWKRGNIGNEGNVGGQRSCRVQESGFGEGCKL